MITDNQTGLGGRYLLPLAKRNHSPLPWTRLGVGSPVVFSPNTAKGATGRRVVVCERAQGSLRIALASMSDDLEEHETWRPDLLVEDHPDVRLARKLVKEATGLFRQAGR